MTTFLLILCIVLIIYIIGAIVSFMYYFNTLTNDINNDSLDIIFALFSFLIALFAGVFWPMIIYLNIKEYFKKDKIY